MRRKLTVIMLTGAIMVSCVACNSNKKQEDAMTGEVSTTEAAKNDEQSDDETEKETTDDTSSEEDNSQQNPVDESNKEAWNEQTGANYHKVIKKAGDEMFLLSEDGIYSVNLDQQITTVIYTASKGKSIQSYCLNNGIIYYIETDYRGEEPVSTLARVNVDGTNNQTLITDNLTGAEVSVYEDILYVSSWDKHACYKIQEDGTLSEKLDDNQTYYSMLTNVNTENAYNELMSVGDSLNRYQAIWIVDSEGALWRFQPEDGTSKEYNIQEQTAIAIAEPYIITMSYEETGYQFYLLNMDTMESKPWFEGNESFLDSDEFGCYFAVGTVEEGQKHSYEYITWDGTKTTLFEVETIPGLEYETASGVRNFSVIDGTIYYQYGDVDKMYLMSRDVKNMSQVNKLGTPYLDKNYSAYGQVENEMRTEMYEDDPSRTLIDIYYDQLVFTGNTEAVKKINQDFLEIKEANIKAAIDFARQDEAYLMEEENVPAYSYTSYITGITFFNEHYVCIEQSEYTYTGGAHGMPMRYYYVLDLKTGDRLLLEDIVSESEDEIHTIAATYFQKMYEEAPAAYFEGAVDTVKSNAGYNDMFYLTDDGIVFYFPPYDLAAYAAGFIEIEVPYSEFHLKIDVTK